MHTILGAGGAVGSHLFRELSAKGCRVRLVRRRAQPVPGAAETLAADLSEPAQAAEAVAGSDVAYLLAGLKYDLEEWRRQWPRIMANAIEACKRAGARLVFFDNVYMYGKVDGPMTEETPFNPSSRKGEVRAAIAGVLLREIAQGSLTAMIARSADFYGPGAGTSIANILVFEKLAKRARASWLVDDRVPHSFTFTPDAARSLVLLAGRESAWNQTWHLPTAAHPPTGRQIVEMAARALGVPARHRVLSRPMIRLAGLFDSTVRETYEMLYQNDRPYVFDSSKFEAAFGVAPTPYDEGIERTAASCGKPR